MRVSDERRTDGCRNRDIALLHSVVPLLLLLAACGDPVPPDSVVLGNTVNHVATTVMTTRGHGSSSRCERRTDPDPYIPLPFERRTAAERPVGHAAFLVVAALMCLGFASLAWVRRRAISTWWADVGRGGHDPPMTGGEGWALAGILVAAVAIRMVMLGRIPGYEAEWGSVEQEMSLFDLLFHGKETLTNPPLLRFIQHFVFQVTLDPWLYRLPMVLFGTGLVWASWRAGRRMFTPGAGLVTSLLIAVHPVAVAWSQTVREYMPVTFFLMLALPHAWRLSRGGRDRDAVALAVFASLAIWTHYVSLMALLPVFLYAAWCLRRNRAGFVRLAMSGLGILAAFAPLIPYFFYDFTTKQGENFPVDYAEIMLTFVTGLPLGAGWALVAIPILGRVWRSPAGRFLVFVAASFFGLQWASRSLIFWESPYSTVIVPICALLLADPLSRLTGWLSGPKRFVAVGIVATAMLATTGLQHAVPTRDQRLWHMVFPYLWRSVSHQLFAETIRSDMRRDHGRHVCRHLLVTPFFISQEYLRYLGPVTLESIGKEPFMEPNFITLTVDLDTGRGPGPFHITGMSRYYQGYPDFWTDLEAYLCDHGCFWYSRTRQNCRDRTGQYYSATDCEWLSRNCEVRVSMADGELYYCALEGGERSH